MKISLKDQAKISPALPMQCAATFTGSALPLEFVDIPDEIGGAAVVAVAATVTNADGAAATAPCEHAGEVWRVTFAASCFEHYGFVERGVSVALTLRDGSGNERGMVLAVGDLEVKRSSPSAAPGDPEKSYQIKGEDIFVKTRVIDDVQHYARQEMSYDAEMGAWGADWLGDYILVDGEFVPFQAAGGTAATVATALLALLLVPFSAFGITATKEYVDRKDGEIAQAATNYTDSAIAEIPAPDFSTSNAVLVATIRDEVGPISNDVAALSDSVKTNAAAIATLVDTTATLSDSIVTGISNLSTRVDGKVEQTDFDAATNSIAGTIAPLAGIPALIPAQASPTNQLADKQFVNSSIATSTANFCGTSAATNEDAFVEWLEAIEVANDNDYVFWQTEDGDGNAVFKRYKYVEDPSGLGEEALAGHWLFEYDLNNSSFTAVQWAAINSGVTPEAVAKIANAATKAEAEALRNDKLDKSAVVSPSPSATAGQAADAKATGDALEPLLFAQYYPDGSVKSATEFTSGIKYNDPDTTNRTITVKPFCNTGTAANDNSNLSGRVVIPPFVDAGGNGYISDDGTRYKVVGVSAGSDTAGGYGGLLAIVAPSTVTIIGDLCFFICPSLASVSLPAVSEFGQGAFDSCTSLASASLPATTSIGRGAFGGCTSLASVFLPAVSNLSDRAFVGCRSLVSVDFGATRSSVPTVDVRAFYGVPSTCKMVVPDSLYDEWTAASGWSDLYDDGNGYKFLKHSEWEYARKYEVDEKADKPATFTTGNLAKFDSNGNPTDSGKKPSDFQSALTPQQLANIAAVPDKLDKSGGIVTGPVLFNSANPLLGSLTLGFNTDPERVENTVETGRSSDGDIYLRIRDTTLAEVVIQKLPRTSGTFALTAGTGHNGNLAEFDSDGNLVDSHKKPSDFADATNVYTKAEMDAQLGRRGVDAMRDMESRFYVVTTNVVVSSGDGWTCDWDGVTLDKKSILTWSATVGGVDRMLRCELLIGSDRCRWFYNPNAKMMGGVSYQTNGSLDDTVLDFAISDDNHLTFTRVMASTNVVVTTNYVAHVAPVELPAAAAARGVTFRDDRDRPGEDQNVAIAIGVGAVARISEETLLTAPSNKVVRSAGVAIGGYAVATNANDKTRNQAVAIGWHATATGINGIAIGSAAVHADETHLTDDTCPAATGNEAIAIGYGAKGTAEKAIAAGYGARGDAAKSIVFGYKAKADAANAVQIGTGTNSAPGTVQFGHYQVLDAGGQVPYERVAGAVAQAGVEFEVALSNAVRRILAGGNMAVVGDGSEGEQILEPKVGGLSEVEFVPNTNGQYEASTLVYLDPPPQAARNYDILISEIPEPMWLGTNGWETVALENRLHVGFTDLPPQYGVTMHVDESCGFPSSPRVASVTNAPTVVKLREVSTNKVLVVVKPYRLEDL